MFWDSQRSIYSFTLKDTIDKHVCMLWVNLPEPPFAWLVFLPWNLPETLVEGEIVSDGILQNECIAKYVT